MPSPTAEPNEEESRLLDEAHLVVINVLADRLKDSDTGKQKSEESSDRAGDPSSTSLRLDVLLARFPCLNRDDLLAEVRARREGSSGGGAGGKRRAGRRTVKPKGKKKEEEDEEEAASKPKRTRKRRGKEEAEADASKPKRKRERRSKKGDAEEEIEAPKPKRKVGRPKKDEETRQAEAKVKAEAKAKAEQEREELERKYEARKRKVQENSDKRFDEMFEELVRYKAEHGHVNVPQKRNDRLAQWVNTQRKEYKWLRDGSNGGTRTKWGNKSKSYLTAGRIQRLYDIGFQFRTRSGRKNYTFEERLEQLKAAKALLGFGGVEGKEGDGASGGGTFGINDIPKKREEWVAKIGGEVDAAVGSGRDDDPYHGLRSWLVVQIECFHKLMAGKKPHTYFTHERAQNISDIGFVLPTEFARDQLWEKRFQELLEYSREHGNCLVKKTHPGGLGNWVLAQRKRHKELLTKQYGGDEELLLAMDERSRRLKEVGFVFSIRVRRWRRKPVEEEHWE